MKLLQAPTLDYRSLVPVEVWHECWSYAEDCDLRNLATACRLFRDICQSLLFQGLVYELPKEVGLGEIVAVHSRLSLLDERIAAIAASPSLIPFIRSWDLDGVRNLNLAYPSANSPRSAALEHLAVAYQSFLVNFTTILPAFKFLRGISFAAINIEEHHLLALQQLPALTRLFLDGVTLTCTVCTPPLSLETFDFIANTTVDEAVSKTLDSISFFANDTLREVWIDLWHCNGKLLRSFIDNGACHNLRQLAMYLIPDHLALLFQLLEVTLKLESLILFTRMADFFDWEPGYPALPAYALPHLKTFYGLGSLAAYLISDRPVERIDIGDDPDRYWQTYPLDLGDGTMMKLLTTSSKPLLQLILPTMKCNTRIFTFIFTHFPHLKVLSLILEDVVAEVEDENSTGNASNREASVLGNGDAESLQAAATYAALLSHICLHEDVLLPPTLEILCLTHERHLPLPEEEKVIHQIASRYLSLQGAAIGTGEQFWLKESGKPWTAMQTTRSPTSELIEILYGECVDHS